MKKTSYSCAFDVIDMINITAFCHRRIILLMTVASVALILRPQNRGCYKYIIIPSLT
ncbi:hypothetical protein OPAG_08662 [Rhodococcus opacus PD630]|nr:hypothetical protein OPAG_08662 [Rhodococcus opacus PD630]